VLVLQWEWTSTLLGLFFDVFDLRIAHDVNTSDADNCFHGLVKGHKALASNGHDYGEFTLDKQFINGEFTTKWGGVNGADGHDPFDLTISYRTLLLAVLLDSRIVEDLIMLITSTKSELNERACTWSSRRWRRLVLF